MNVPTNILISYSKFATSRSGGARESLLTLLNGLNEKKQIFADVYQTPPINDLPKTDFEYKINTNNVYTIPKLTWANQIVVRKQWRKYLRNQISPKHDFLITLNALAPVSVDVASEADLPSLFFTHSLALTGYEKYNSSQSHLLNILNTDLGGRVQYPFLWKNFEEYKRAAQQATYTVANSEFTAAKIEDLFGIDSIIIYPPIDIKKYHVKYNNEGYVTMVNPRAEYKGTDIFINIASTLFDEEFLLVGPIESSKIKKQVKQTPNITHWEWCEDMREAYSESKVVVVPSRVEESFGRVPAEAMVSGIPCVVSNRGGLPEVVGDTGEVVNDVENINSWITAIHRALNDHHPEDQKKRAERFSTENQIKKLVRLIEKL